MFSTVSLFLRKPENCWCNYNCSTLVSLSVGLVPCSFFYCWCPELCPRSFIFSHKTKIGTFVWTFALFVLKMHSRCCLHLKQVCCSLEKTLTVAGGSLLAALDWWSGYSEATENGVYSLCLGQWKRFRLIVFTYTVLMIMLPILHTPDSFPK